MNVSMISKIFGWPVTFFAMGIWFVFGAIIPVLSYKLGTSENVTSKVISEPFIGGDKLVYQWSGDVLRSCPITLRRSFVDSDNVVTTMTPLTFEALPENMLGHASYEIQVSVPQQIAEGPAVYTVVEVPKCSWLQSWRPITIQYPPVSFVITR